MLPKDEKQGMIFKDQASTNQAVTPCIKLGIY